MGAILCRLFIEIIRMFCKVAAFVLFNDLTWVRSQINKISHKTPREHGMWIPCLNNVIQKSWILFFALIMIIERSSQFVDNNHPHPYLDPVSVWFGQFVEKQLSKLKQCDERNGNWHGWMFLENDREMASSQNEIRIWWHTIYSKETHNTSMIHGSVQGSGWQGLASSLAASLSSSMAANLWSRRGDTFFLKLPPTIWLE